MTMLPDIDEQTYTADQQDEFRKRQQEAQAKQSFWENAQSQVAQLHQAAGSFAGAVGETIGGAAQAIGGAAQAANAAPFSPDQQAQLEAAAGATPSPPPASVPGRSPYEVQPQQDQPQQTPFSDDQRKQLEEFVGAAPKPQQQAQPGGYLPDQLAQLQAVASAPLQAAGQQINRALGGGKADASSSEIRDYITQAAVQRGIDPDIALRVANSEGGMEAARRGTFNTGSSWWPFQLHYGGQGYEQLGTTAGMGNEFSQKTGYAPGDPNAWQASVDFALDKAKQGGWGQWYGAKAQGITGFQGIGDTGLQQATGGLQQATPGYSDISQFGDKELTPAEAQAACGPAAAVRFAQRFGRNPTLREATDLASTVGWTQGGGMAGIGSEQQLLKKMGVDTTLVPGAQWDKFAQEAQTGNPITISTGAHYFSADGYDPRTGAFHVGKSGADLRGGAEWMTPGEITAAAQRLGGGEIQGALFANDPTVPTPSTARAYTPAQLESKPQEPSLLDQLVAGSAAQLARGRDWFQEQMDNLDRTLTNVGLGSRPGEPPIDMRTPSAAVQRQLAGQEDAQLGPITIPGGIAGRAGIVGEGLGELNLGTYAGRLGEGLGGELRRDPAANQALNDMMDAQLRLANANTTGEQAQARADAMLAQQQYDARKADINANRDMSIGGIYQQGLASPDRETAELLGQLGTGVVAAGLAPSGLTSGAGRFLASLAADPTGAPFGLATEGLGALARGAGRALGMGDRLTPQAANIVEQAAHYPAGGLEDRFEQLARQSAMTSPDGLAHLDLSQLDTPFEHSIADVSSKEQGVTSVHIPTLDELRDVVKNGLPFGQWYTDMAEKAADTYGAHNLPEFVTNFGITSQRTSVEDNLAETLRIMRMTREAAADAPDPRAAALARLEAATTKKDDATGVLGEISGLAGSQKKAAVIKAYTQGDIPSAGPKTPSYIGNIMSAFNGLFDPRTTNDTWIAQMFGVRGETPLNRYANNDNAYRTAEVALNELAREMGMPGHQAQAAAWYTMQRLREAAPDLFHSIGLERGDMIERGRKYKTGGSTLGDALREAQARGIFGEESSGQVGAWGLPKVQAELSKIGQLPEAVRTMSNPTGVDMMRRYKGKYKGPERVPSGPEFRQEQRILAEAEAPAVQLPQLPLQRLRQEGLLTDSGLLPALRATPHRLTELSDGSSMISLPGGNSDTARYVASLFGDALGAEKMTISFPDIRSANAGGLALRVDPQQVGGLVKQLEDLGAQVVVGTDRGSIHIPLTQTNEGVFEAISAKIGAAGDAVKDVRDYTGEAQDIGRTDFARHLEEGGSRFAPTGPTRPDLLERTLGVLREAAGPGAALVAKGATPLRNEVVQSALGGAVAGGYQAAQEPGATPSDIAQGALGGSVLGAGRRAIGSAAGIRQIGRVARVAEDTGVSGGDIREQIARQIAESAARAEESLRAGRRPVAEEVARAAETAPTPPPPSPAAAETVAREVPAADNVPVPPTSERYGLNIDKLKYMPREVQDILQATYNDNPELMDAARRGVLPDAVVREMAAGLDPKRVQAAINLWKPGQAQNAEVGYAMRQALADSGRSILDAQQALAEAPRSTNARNDLLMAMTRHQAIQEAVTGVTAEGGRALRQFSQPIEGENPLLKQFLKMAKSKGLAPEELVDELARADFTDPRKVADAIERLNPANPMDRLAAIWYFNLLSAPTTHMRNVLGNALSLVGVPVEGAGAAAADPLARGIISAIGGKTTGRERFLGEAGADIMGALGGTGQAFNGLKRALREGPSAESILAERAHPEVWKGTPLAFVHAPGRALEGEDAFFRTLNEGAAMHRMAYRQAMREGAKDVGGRMQEIMTGADRSPAGQQAYKKFLTALEEEGKYRTFQQDTGLSNALLRFRRDVPGARYLMPFVKTPVNMMQYTLERSPLGYFGIMRDLLTKGGRERLMQRGSGDLADRISRATIGSMIMGGLGVWGGDNLTGRAPDNPNERDAFYRQGKQPYSFRSPLDGNWVSYQTMQPYTPLIAAAANINQELRAHPEKSKDYGGLALMGAIAGGQSLLDMPWTQGLLDATDLMSGQGQIGRDPLKSAQQWMYRQAQGAVPASGLMRTLARMQDNTLREPQNLLDAFQQNVPYLQQNVQPRLNAFGEPRRGPAGGLEALLPWNPSDPTHDPVENELMRLQLDRHYDVQPGFVGNKVTVRGQPVELNPQQEFQYQQQAGQMTYAMLQLVVGSNEWNALDDAAKVELVGRIESKVRDAVRTQMEPELWDQAIQAKVDDLALHGAATPTAAVPAATATATPAGPRPVPVSTVQVNRAAPQPVPTRAVPVR